LGIARYIIFFFTFAACGFIPAKKSMSMRKRVFTLVAAACLSVAAASAQQEGLTGLRPYLGETYSPTISYFLKAVKGNQSYYIILDDNDRLALRPEAQLPRSFAEVRSALWFISRSESAYTGEIAFTFNNLFRSTHLSLSHREVTAGLQQPGIDANIPGGDIYRWLPSVGPTPSATVANFFYVFAQAGGNEVIVLGAGDDLRVVPRLYSSFSEAKTAAARSSSDVLLITPCLAEGFLPLTANDLNIRLTSDVFNIEKKSGLFAAEDDRFHLTIKPSFAADVPFSSGSNYHLQAQGVHVVEGEGGLASDESYKVEKPYADTVNHWVALYSYFRTPEGLVDQGYVGVDTSYYRVSNGIEANAIRIASFGDVWYHNTSRARLLDSYLFKFLYDPGDGQIKVISRAYITQPIGGTWSSSKEQLLYSRNYARNGHLTAFFAGEGRYVPTLVAEDDASFSVKSGDIDSYRSTNIPSNLYTLRVEGSHDPSRVGKYLRINLAGEIEFIKEGDIRLNHPTSQWAIESSLYIAKIFNREYPDSPAADEYFGKSARTYGVGEDEKVPLFVMSGGDRDTLRYVAVSDELKSSSTLGYYATGTTGDMSSLRLTMYHGHDLMGGKGGYLSTAGDDKILWVSDDSDGALRFGIEDVFSEEYGYEPNISGVAKLRRHYYRFNCPHDLLGTRQYIGFSEVSEAHRYFLTNDPVTSPTFLLREVEINDKKEVAYMFCEINPVTSSILAAVSVDKTSGALIRVAAPTSDMGFSAFSFGKAAPGLYVRITDVDGSPVDVSQKGFYRPSTYAQEYFVAKPSAYGSSFNFLAFQAMGDQSLPVSFTVRYVRGVTMPQYLIINNYKDEGGGAFSGDFLAVLDPISGNPAWGYTSRHNIADATLLWHEKTRLGFIPAKVKADGFLYIDGDPVPRKVVYTAAEREEEGVYDYFFFSFRRFSEESDQSEDFLIEGGRPDGLSAGSVNYYIQEHVTLPVTMQSSYSTIVDDPESIFRMVDVISGGKSPSSPPKLSVRDVSASSLIVAAGRGEILVSGAEGKQITVSTLLGRRLQSRYAASEERFAVPAGILVVSVEGERAVKVLVK
jgi:hypothetical protein